MFKGYPVIDLHCHLRNDIPGHTKTARENGIDAVVYMANCNPPLDNLEMIKKSMKKRRYCRAIPVSAITKNLEGKNWLRLKKFGLMSLALATMANI